MIVNTDSNKPIKMWLNDIEDGALMQAKNLANLPFTFSHVAIMPDSHQGYGMPIGSVLATDDVIIPNAVGVDIGCGMCALQLNIKDIVRNDLIKIVDRIKQKVPVGFNKHEKPQSFELMPDNSCLSSNSVCWLNFENAMKSLGTLGGGNHFIEIQKGSDGYIWIMVHSGSRNLGKQVCDFYNKEAKILNRNFFSVVDDSYDLAFIPKCSHLFNDYFNEMDYCVSYALSNRKLIIEMVVEAFFEISGYIHNDNALFINKSHNYAKYERHFGKNVIIHRKGATSAELGEMGIIPGSQGTKSYIVRGLGNRESFKSCSHGAGRAMGRKQAQRDLSLESEKKILDEKGIIHSMKTVNDLDEAPSAYKDINVVMENQKDLCEILVELSPLAVIKG